ncbi:MAG: phosphodiester glycosidase family protein [Rhodoferax sp.]|nr:phosphodiester glycosidase family protein [Rhodoferax sp.]
MKSIAFQRIGWRTAVAVLGLWGVVGGALARQELASELTWEQIRPGLRYAQQDIAIPGAQAVHRLHWLALDLAQPDLYLMLTPQACAGVRMSTWDLPPVVASVNASFFTREFFTRGHTVSQGKPWAGSLRHIESPLAACSPNRECEVVHQPPAGAAPDWQEVAAGVHSLVLGGVARTPEDDAQCGSFCSAAHPRSAVGLDSRRRTMVWVAAEGRQKYAVGLPLATLASLMARQGVAEAINLDGGGSTSMHIKGQRRTGRPDNEPEMRRIANAWIISTRADIDWSLACAGKEPVP